MTGLTTGRFCTDIDLHLCSSSLSSAAIRLKSTEEGGMWSASAPGSSAASLHKNDMNIWPASSLIFENCSNVSVLRAARFIDTVNTWISKAPCISAAVLSWSCTAREAKRGG